MSRSGPSVGKVISQIISDFLPGVVVVSRLQVVETRQPAAAVVAAQTDQPAAVVIAGQSDQPAAAAAYQDQPVAEAAQQDQQPAVPTYITYKQILSMHGGGMFPHTYLHILNIV